jgi:catechol 2,3-dioxygenase-like lactoylglutathione lyase family enzyme
VIEVNGIAHIILTVNRFEECVAFYDRLMPELGLPAVHRVEEFVYYVGGRTGVAIRKADAHHERDAHDPERPGLHHLCFRARSREDVDELYAFLLQIGATMVRAPEEGPWAPGYYSLSFLDPAGIRHEVNHVPGKGVLAEGAAYEHAPGYPVQGLKPGRPAP